MDRRSFEKLLAYLKRVPAVEEPVAHGAEEGGWWVKFSLDLENPLAWNVVQEFGHVLNYLSIEERIPTVFKPGVAAAILEWRSERVSLMGDRVRRSRLSARNRCGLA